MASTLTTIGLPKKITLGNSNIATKITLPGVPFVRVRFETNAGKYSNAGTDAAEISADDFEIIPADAATYIPLSLQEHGNPPVIYLASATGSTVVRVTPCMTRG